MLIGLLNTASSPKIKTFVHTIEGTSTRRREKAKVRRVLLRNGNFCEILLTPLEFSPLFLIWCRVGSR